MEVRPGQELEEDVIVKDVGEGSREEVVVGNEVDDGDDQNGKGGVI